MEHKTGSIPGLPFQPSPIFFGTSMGPLLAGDEAAFGVLDQAAENGVNAFDCARSYGRAEEMLGRWMQARGCREKVLVLTKAGDIRDGVVRVNRQVIREQMARSLETLKTDVIDLFLLHRDDPETPVEEFIETLNEARKAGMIRLSGVSNWTRERIEKANRYAAEKGLEGFAVSSPNFGLARQMKDLWGGGCVTLSGPEHEEDRAWYRKTGMPVIAYSSLGRGFFSGRFRSGDYETAREVLDSYAQKGYLYEENMERLRRAEKLAEKYGVTVPEIAMRYIFSSGMNLFAVVSTASRERLRMNLRAAEHPLSQKETEYLEGNDDE